MKRMLMELSLNSKTFLKSEIKKKKSFFIFKWNRIFIQFWFSIESGKKSL